MDATGTWLPYCGAAPSPTELITRWNLDPPLIAALLLLPAWGLTATGGMTTARRRCFLAAWGLLVLLFVSPLCALSSALFGARVVHHVLLAAAIAPLLAAALPRVRPPGGIIVWTAAHLALFWLWHAPPVYAWALSHDAGYWLMQLTILGSAIGFWTAIRRASAPAAVMALFAAMVAMGALGALITLATRPLYAPHQFGPLLWGLTPLEDQQIAGLIMWAPAAGIYLAAALLIVARWFERERHAGVTA